MRLVKGNVVKVKTDKTAIKRLIEAGYVPDDEKTTAKASTKEALWDYSSMTYQQLQEEAKKHGLKHVGIKKADLLKSLNGVKE